MAEKGAVTEQPLHIPLEKFGNFEWAPKPMGEMPGSPPGLSILAHIGSLHIKSKVELLEAITGWEVTNKYGIYNENGQMVMVAFEESSCLQRQCCGPARAFVMHFTDANNQEVMRLVRKFQCCAGCCWCATPLTTCSMWLEVQAPPGNTIGYIRQEKTACRVKLGIFDKEERTLGHMLCPCCVCICPCESCREIPFAIHDPNMTTQTGTMYKVWSNIAQECCTMADNFRVDFPSGADVNTRILYIAATFLMDFMLFQNQGGGGG